MRTARTSDSPRLTLLAGGAGARAVRGRAGPEGHGDAGGGVALAHLAAEIAEVVSEPADGPADGPAAEAPLRLPLALSLCMARSRAGADDMVRAMRLVRSALLRVGALDPHGEPVPLVTEESRHVAVEYAAYLQQLFHRAAAATGTDRRTVAAGALAALG